MQRLNVGLVGAGVVGGGVYEILANRRQDFLKLGIDVVITKICVRDVAKKRDFKIDSAQTTIVSNIHDIIDDPSIGCVVELMGGTGIAREVVMQAIAKDKHVVTANKALVASCLGEIESLLGIHSTVQFGYEAAVCGGIPIINILQQSFLGDKITEVTGIMNGTTNFMLTKMESEGSGYSEVLAEAQALGYAESDPTADVEGFDVQAKIALVAKLAFGRTVPAASISTVGISGVDAVDFAYAARMRSTVKLIGCARLVDPSTISVFVSPALVSLTHPAASARGAGNIVQISSENMGSSSYSGPGAGRYPTANSVVSDLLRVANGVTAAGPFPVRNEDLAFDPDYISSFYIRVTVAADQPGVVGCVGVIAEQQGVDVQEILREGGSSDSVSVVMTTSACRVSQVQSLVEEISSQGYVQGRPAVMVILK
mmetsp:Transcript_48062/g.65441  ORF Transcript_48062/g.65441 Transcript_48062/m.65441 type:complete len:427 (-) Transcript_48062:265-1545(-)